MAAANLDLVQGQFSDGCGKLDGDGAETATDACVCLLDVVAGEPGDRSGPLGIEEQQQAGEAVFGLERVVVQQTSGGGPAGLIVHRLGGAVPSLGRKGEIAGDLLGQGPAHEVACLLAKTGVVAGRPTFEVGLSAGGKGQFQAVEPVQEVDARPQVLPCDLELVVRGSLPRLRRRSRRRRCQVAYRCRILRPSAVAWEVTRSLTCLSRRTICSSRVGRAPLATRTLRMCSTTLPLASSSRAS